MMRKRILGAIVGSALGLGLLGAGSASAATMVGNSCAANIAAPNYTLVSIAGDAANVLPNAIPTAGVITSWTFDSELGLDKEPAVSLDQQLRIMRPTGTGKQLKVVGESAPVPVHDGPNSFPTRIPVQAGDLIGATGVLHTPSESVSLVAFCEETKPGDKIGAIEGNLTTGLVGEPKIEESELALPITVAVEPDADGDGYGDETQDQCPTDASTQGPCPVKAPPPAPAPPAPPTTLSGTAAAKKGLVTVTVTASAQANVTVAGSVQLGKGKTVKLSGGTQTVTPGSLAKFTVLFPAKLKTALKQAPPSKKLTLSFSASAPGATSTGVTVKVAGQKKPPRHHHR
jgi:hypothetical protein